MLTMFKRVSDNSGRASHVPAMKITAVETIYLPRGVTVHVGSINYLWVRIHTDEGLIGLGESYPNAEAEAAVVHSRLAAVLLGRDPSAIDRLWADMFLAVSYSGWAGAEMRALSAVDIALWDLMGKATVSRSTSFWVAHRGNPSASTTPATTEWISIPTRSNLPGNFSLSNIRAMKIWPFDPIARETGGNHISAEQLGRQSNPCGAYQGGVRRLDRRGHRISRLLESAMRDQNCARFGEVSADVAGGDAAAG